MVHLSVLRFSGGPVSLLCLPPNIRSVKGGPCLTPRLLRDYSFRGKGAPCYRQRALCASYPAFRKSVPRLTLRPEVPARNFGLRREPCRGVSPSAAGRSPDVAQKNPSPKNPLLTFRRAFSELLKWCTVHLRLALFAWAGFLLCGLTMQHTAMAGPSNIPKESIASVSSSVIERKKYKWTEILNYQMHKILSMQTFGKLTAVMLAATPIVVIGGVSYRIVTGRNLSGALFKIYSVMNKLPGASAVDSENSAGLFLCSAAFFAGTFTVAILLGIVCSDVSSAMANVRNGNYQIIEEGHMVILNVNRSLRPILRQVAEASKERGSFQCPIVLLDDTDKEELDRIVCSAAEGLNLKILTRKGCTHDVMDLRRVAASQAECVIWLEPYEDEISVAAKRASAIASLKVLGCGEDRPARMIVQTSQDSVKSKKELTDVPLASRSPPKKENSNFTIVEVYEEENFDRFLAQCALQPHLSGIMCDVFQHNEGKEFYITEKTDFGGKPYSFARRCFYNAVVCGIYKPSKDNDDQNGQVFLNPPEDFAVSDEDELVVLCSDLWHTQPSSDELPAPSEWTGEVQRHHTSYGSENVVVLCFGESGFADSGLVEELGRFASKPTNITIVANSVEDREEQNDERHTYYVKGNPASFRILKNLRGQKIDSIVLAGLEDLSPRVADAQFISSLIQLQEAANAHWEDKDGFNIVSPVNFPETKVVANHLISQGNRSLSVPIELDMLLPTELSSGVLVQVAGFPQLNLVFKDLLNASGSELYIRNADEFGLIGRGPIKYYEVSDTVRRFGETFLGVLTEDRSFIIAPDALSEREYASGDKVVVLAAGPEPEEPVESSSQI